LIPDADQKTVMDNILALTVELPTQSHEHSVIAQNGDIRWQHWTNRAIFDDRGKVVGYQSIGEDITERKLVEEALKESEELHRITLSNISDAVFITDDAGVFTYICPNVTLIFGYSYEEVSALGNIEKLLGINRFNLKKLRPSREVKNIEHVIQDKSGVSHILLVNVKRVTIKGGTVLYTCRDITERKRAEEAITELSFRLWNAQEMERKRIASELHDDFGQTLAFLKIKIKNIQNKLPSNQNELKEEFENTLKYADQLIEKVRTLSHGLTPLILNHLGLTASLQSLAEELSQYAYMNIQKYIANIDKMFSPLAEIAIYRIFQEIFTNIEKHANADYLKIEIKKQKCSVSFQIEDNGKGFDLEKIELNYLNEKRIGLASLKERVRMLGGRFKIQSHLNEGTKINFTIPFEKQAMIS